MSTVRRPPVAEGARRFAAPARTNVMRAAEVEGTNAPVSARIDVDALVGDPALDRLRRAQDVTPKNLADVGTVKLPGVVYRRVDGGPVELFHGSVIEGSVDHGGLQPHYVVDLEDARLAPLLAAAGALNDGRMPFHRRCAAVKQLVEGAMRGKAYAQPAYLDMLARARVARRNVTPGDYVAADAGVCREHALITHVALREAGVESRYVYVKSKTPTGHEEDHAFALALDRRALVAWERGDRTAAWVVDAYTEWFDGRQLKSVLAGTTEDDACRPDVGLDGFGPDLLGHSARVLAHPTYWVPVRALSAPSANVDVTALDFSRARVVRFDGPQPRE